MQVHLSSLATFDFMTLIEQINASVDGERNHFMTLPGAVVFAASYFDGSERPNIRRLSIEDSALGLTAEFDSVAVHKGPPKLVDELNARK